MKKIARRLLSNTKKKKVLLALFVLFISLFLLVKISAAAEMDKLIDKLVEKGILTRDEAKQIIVEVEQENKLKPDTVKSAETIKLKGDLRIRYQNEEDGDELKNRQRGRYRARLGAETKVNSNTSAALGLVAGENDPRSRNLTFQNYFETPGMRLDYAYTTYKAYPWATAEVGKMKEVRKLVFSPSDLLWDSDINPEGASVLFSKKVNNKFSLFANTGVWILDESSRQPDPFMCVLQPGFQYELSNDSYFKAGATYYGFKNVIGSSPEHSSGTNTREGGTLKYNYSAWNPTVELAFKFPFGFKSIPFLSLYGEYIKNPSPPVDNTGYVAGFRFGHKKVLNANEWQIGYSYRFLASDAWLDTFPDSDIFGGSTNVRGSEITLFYGLNENSYLGVDYYMVSRIEGDDKRNLLQLDWNLKF
ncbi:MAG: putative porin [Armatimonadota bacterium]